MVLSLQPMHIFLKILFIYVKEGEGRRKRGRETSMYGCLLLTLTGDLACNPGMCPDWELNQQPFGSQVSTQSTESHQPGPNEHFLKREFCNNFYANQLENSDAKGNFLKKNKAPKLT